jgi:hypothetical protein
MMFLPNRFVPAVAASAFVRLTSNPQELAAFCLLMRNVYLTWQKAEYGQKLQVIPAASLQLFDRRLQARLASEGFDEVKSSLVVASQIEELTRTDGNARLKYDAAWIGGRVALPSVPTLPRAIGDMCIEHVGATPVAGPRERLRQSVVHVCTAQKPRN